MEESEKILTRLKLAATLRVILAKNKKVIASNKLKGVEDLSLIDSIRQLEASSRLSYTIVQGVVSGQRDIQFSSLISIIEEGFGITLSEFAKAYDAISEDDIKLTKKGINIAKRKKASPPKKR